MGKKMLSGQLKHSDQENKVSLNCNLKYKMVPMIAHLFSM